MRVTRCKGDKNLQDLTRRLFVADHPEAGLASAAESLADANPHLPLRGRGSLAKAIEPGTLIAVPDVEGATPTAASEPLGQAGAAALLERTKAAIGRLAQDQDAELQRWKAELGETLDLIQSKPFKAAAKRDEQLAAALASVQENTKASLEDLATAERDQRLALDGADQAITGLLELIDGRGAGPPGTPPG